MTPEEIRTFVTQLFEEEKNRELIAEKAKI
jgi:hypothetical protein